MTQYYESEVLYHLMEREGFNIPSSVPKYESEIKAYLIDQVKLAYPKLTDYEAEWLLYNYTKHLPADFPISRVTNVTEASFENVVPFAYQSAILKGNTKYTNDNGDVFDKFFTPIIVNWSSGYVNVDGTIADGGHYVTQFIDIAGFDGFNFGNDETIYAKIGFYDENKTFISRSMGSENGSHGIVMSQTFPPNTKYIRASFTTKNVYFKDFYNRDLTLPLSLSNVKMPVLTTTGKNLFGGKWELNNGLYGYTKISNELGDYTLSLTDKDANVDISGVYFGFTGNGVNAGDYADWIISDGTIVTNSLSHFSFRYLSIYPNNQETLDKLTSRFNIQLEEGSVATPYEPYKTNILSTPSDLELCGIGDVKDTLDCLTGELTQRVGEINTASMNESYFNGYTLEPSGLYRMTINVENLNINGLIKCDKLPVVPFMGSWNLPYECITIYSGGILLYLKDTPTVESYINKAIGLNLIIQYGKAQNSVKIVELKTVNEKGEITFFMPLEGTMNVQSSGEIIQPTFDMSVPVEATTQNLASFVDLEMEE